MPRSRPMLPRRQTRQTRTMRRKGFSLIEMMVVLAMLGIIVAISAPRIQTIRNRSNMRAARDEAATAIAIARSAAIQKGQKAYFRTANDSISAVVSSGQVVLMQRSLLDMYGAKITPLNGGPAQLNYDTRGFADYGSQVKYEIKINSKTADTLCVTKLGLIAKWCL